MKHLGWTLALLTTACTASVDDNPNGGDDTPGDGDVGVGNDDIRFRITSVADERADQIAFATGEPVHTHAGPRVQLGGADCPDVYKHAYLMSTTAPLFGREVEPNALAWTIEARGAAEYRVRTEADTAQRDWTPIAGTTIELHRDDVTSGKYLLDVRVGESVATTCFIFHPLAAPLEIATPVRDLDAMTFAQAAPLSQLLGMTNVPAFSQRFTHHTAEPIAFAVDVPTPTGTYVRAAVDDYVVARTYQPALLCSRDSDGFESGDPLCTDTSAVPDLLDATITGPLASGTWTLHVIDESTGTDATGCSITAGPSLRASCQLPARAPTAAARSYRIVLSVRNLEQLAPSTEGPYAEHTIAGQVFTGRVLDTTARCASFVQTTKFGVTIVTCATATEHTHIHALDQARITFAPVAFALASSVNAALPATALAAPGIAAFTWDTGNADLPGPH